MLEAGKGAYCPLRLNRVVSEQKHRVIAIADRSSPMFRLPRPAIAGLCTLAAAVLTISLLHTVSAQAVLPVVATDKGWYLPGQTVRIGGFGFVAGERVTLQ